MLGYSQNRCEGFLTHLFPHQIFEFGGNVNQCILFFSSGRQLEIERGDLHTELMLCLQTLSDSFTFSFSELFFEFISPRRRASCARSRSIATDCSLQERQPVMGARQRTKSHMHSVSAAITRSLRPTTCAGNKYLNASMTVLISSVCQQSTQQMADGKLLTEDGSLVIGSSWKSSEVIVEGKGWPVVGDMTLLSIAVLCFSG